MKFPNNKANTEKCFVLGEDRQFEEKVLESTGAFFLDKDHGFAYDSIPDCMGMHVVIDKKGRKTYKEQCALLFETSAQPYSFRHKKWIEESPNVSNLLNDGRMEGAGAIAEIMEDDARLERIMPFLWAGFALLVLVVVIACIAGGIFNDIGKAF